MFDLEVNIEDQVNISISINYVESLPCGTFCVCLFQIFFLVQSCKTDFKINQILL